MLADARRCSDFELGLPVSKQQLRTLDRKTTRLLTIYKSLHSQADVDRLYVKRSKGGRGLISVEDCVNIEVGSLHKYVGGSSERLLIATKDENILDEREEKESVS